MPIRVLNTFPIDPADAARLDRLSPPFTFTHLSLSSRELDAIDDSSLEVLLAGRTPGHEHRTPRLRWIQVAMGGVDHMQDDAAWRRGLMVTNGRGTYSAAIAEYVMWALLDINQRGADRRAAHAARHWPLQDERAHLFATPLAGQTLLLIGYGSIGREVARAASVHGMRILAVKARPGVRGAECFTPAGCGDPQGIIPEQIGGFDQIGDLCADAQAVVVSLPLTNETRGIVDSRVFDALPAGAVAVNVSRGEGVDERSLLRALGSGRLRAAVVDALATEPLPADDELWVEERLMITPHVSAAVQRPSGHGSWRLFYELVAENLRRYADGRPLLNRVDPLLRY